MFKDSLPAYTYYQSYLEQAGVRLNLNVVDTYCKKGFSLSFIIVLLLFCALLILDSHSTFEDNQRFDNLHLIISLMCLIYLIIYSLRYVYFLIIRFNLRKKRKPLILEAYAIVILDVSYKFNKYNKKCAIIYKECGTVKPRFFTGPVKNGNIKNFIPEQVVLLYMHYTNKKLFSIDEEHANQTVSEKRKVFAPLNFQGATNESLDNKSSNKD